MPKKKRKPPKDVALLHGPTEDGEGARFLRFKEGTVSAGEVRPAREGQAVNGAELVRLSPLSEGAPLCEVEVLTPAAVARAGPPKVANAKYRRNWGTIFGQRRARAADEPDEWSVN